MNRIITNPQTKQALPPDNFEIGRMFEDYIVTLFNKRKFRLLEWRSDKRASNGVLPLSSSFPDLEFAYVGRRNVRFAIECKWRTKFKNGLVDWAKKNQIDNYIDFQRESGITVLIAIGIGGHPSNPEKLFVTPLNDIWETPEVPESQLMPYKRTFEYGIHDAEQLALF